MSRIFLSHSSENNAAALALRDWLKGEGWDDVFLDLDPERGIRVGELWEEALRDAAGQCEAVLFLVSRAWLSSEWCRDEFRLVRHLRKRLFGILIEDIALGDLPAVMTREWQLVSIAATGETRTFSVVLPRASQAVEVDFGADGLRRLKIGLQAARLDDIVAIQLKLRAFPRSRRIVTRHRRLVCGGAHAIDLNDAGRCWRL